MNRMLFGAIVRITAAVAILGITIDDCEAGTLGHVCRHGFPRYLLILGFLIVVLLFSNKGLEPSEPS